MQIIYNPAGAGITLGGSVAFTTLQSRLFFLLGQLLNVQVEIQGALALFDRVFEHLDLPIGTQIGGMSAYLEEQKKRGRKTDARILQRVAQAFGPYKVQVALILIAIIFATILGLVVQEPNSWRFSPI